LFVDPCLAVVWGTRERVVSGDQAIDRATWGWAFINLDVALVGVNVIVIISTMIGNSIVVLLSFQYLLMQPRTISQDG